MADGRRHNGGARPGAGRKPKPVEDAQHSVLLALFDEQAERDVVQNMIAIAKMRGGFGASPAAIQAATWLWERKYGRITETTRNDTTQRIIVVYDDDEPTETA